MVSKVWRAQAISRQNQHLGTAWRARARTHAPERKHQRRRQHLNAREHTHAHTRTHTHTHAHPKPTPRRRRRRQIRAALPPAAGPDAFVGMCGPPPMINFACIPNLQKAGYTEENYMSF